MDWNVWKAEPLCVRCLLTPDTSQLCKVFIAEKFNYCYIFLSFCWLLWFAVSLMMYGRCNIYVYWCVCVCVYVCAGGGSVLGSGPWGMGQPRIAASADEASRRLPEDFGGSMLCCGYICCPIFSLVVWFNSLSLSVSLSLSISHCLTHTSRTYKHHSMCKIPHDRFLSDQCKHKCAVRLNNLFINIIFLLVKAFLMRQTTTGEYTLA